MALSNMQQFAIGVDIGSTITRFGIVNHRGEIIKRGIDLPTKKFEKVNDFVGALYQHLEYSINKIAKYNIKGIGVSAPNGNYYTGSIVHAPNLQWKDVVPLAQLMTGKFGLPCSLTNDANAAAVGEMTYGAAKGMKDFILITLLNTGVGSGIVSNGQLILGHDGFAGELGHTIVRPGGRKHWSTGLQGSLEVYASGTGIALTARELLYDSVQPSLLRDHKREDITAEIIFSYAAKGDSLAVECCRVTGQVLGEALANYVMFSSPEAIVLSGEIMKAGDLIIKPAREHMEKNLLPVFQNKVKLILSELNEVDAAILGASALVWEMK